MRCSRLDHDRKRARDCPWLPDPKASVVSQLWLGVHFPSLSLEVCLRQLATDATDIVAVLVEDSRVIATNDVADAAGIMSGCSLATAVGICSELASFPRDAPAEEARLCLLAEMALRFTSHISLAEPDGLRLEVGRSLRLFGGLGTLCDEVESLYRELGHDVQLGVAETPLAAEVLARAGEKTLEDVLLVRTHLAPDAVERFSNMGIARLGQVLSLPGAELSRRFDPALLEYLDRLVGKSPDPQDILVPTETFASAVHLVSSVEDGNALLFPVRRLAGELASWLAARRLGATGIVWTFTALHGEEASLAVRFARARSGAETLFDHTRLRFEGFRPPSEVMSVSLRSESLRPLTAATRPLLPEAPGTGIHGDSTALELVDRLTARLGEEALSGIRTVDDHRPERAWHMEHPQTRRGNRQRAQGELPVRPIWLLPTPVPIRVEDFTLLGECERIETGWWDGAVARDYFVATTSDGRQCWLFRESKSEKESWFLHGYFA